tara:strand:+ start:5059 stop:5259 length:201 start_codon:yes stop_codon:yes gene_type:complete
MSDPETLLRDAWTLLQEADFQLLQTLGDLKDPEAKFNPRDSASKALTLLTQSAVKIQNAKTIIPQS